MAPAGTGLCPDPLEYSQGRRLQSLSWKVSQGCGMRWSGRFLPTQTLLGFCADCGLQDQKKGSLKCEKSTSPCALPLFTAGFRSVFIHNLSYFPGFLYPAAVQVCRNPTGKYFTFSPAQVFVRNPLPFPGTGMLQT